MCLMHTDLPVPEGPRIIEIIPSGRPMLSPRRIRLRPKALCTSMNSMASSAPLGRLSPVCHRYSSSSWGSAGSSTTATRDSSGSGTSSVAGSSTSSRPMGSSGPRGRSSSSALSRPMPNGVMRSSSDWGSWVGAPEELGADHADEVDQDDVEDHRLRRRGAHPYRSTAGVVAVVAADEHDGGGHHHALDHAVEQVGWVLEHPEDQEEPPR